ncbi:cupin domain-containing protein [Roseomonas marmotae]|uniref:Cupin domain-containing protein n=1 Tax=Roseomonas marmotae TaxID=2768161 RepID=A0ABS3K7Q3_9PROT|nr:cupin domain-containing protein [Roseomonas marmotae]MBO1073498.1 cupin domain-containing protein [Roseomonas marmotae]QTI80313.1 cupin domain-containing protein [Roseomonas marmotae]
MTQIHAVDWSAMEWTPVRPGVERKAFTGDGATLALHRIMPGHDVLPHSHSNEQVVYILSGTADFHIGEQVVRLGPGGLALVPPDTVHHIKVVGTEPVLNLDVFTPARPEYVQA